MKLTYTNIPLYAVNTDSPEHAVARAGILKGLDVLALVGRSTQICAKATKNAVNSRISEVTYNRME